MSAVSVPEGTSGRNELPAEVQRHHTRLHLKIGNGRGCQAEELVLNRVQESKEAKGRGRIHGCAVLCMGNMHFKLKYIH